MKIFNIIQEKGSIIYIPSNWYHSVLNLDNFVISINKNWCNEINLIKLFKSINISIEEIRNSLKDDILYVLKRRKLMLEIDLDIEMEFENIIQDVLIKNVGWG